MPHLKVISVLLLITFITLINGEDLEDESGGQKVKEFFDSASRRFREYAGLFTRSMEKDMWICVFLAAALTFCVCFGIYFFDLVLYYTRACIRRLSN